jgi:hypothetical protein
LSVSSPPSPPTEPSGPAKARDLFSRFRQTAASNASVVGAVVVLGGLYLGQGLVADWLTDDEIIDEDDIVAPQAEVFIETETESCDPWILTYSDDFEGDVIDTEAWLLFASPGANGYGTRIPDAVTVDDGNLVLTGQMVDGDLVIGGVAGSYQQTFGRVEVRVRTELDPSETLDGIVGTWPAGNDPDGGAITFYQAPAIAERQPFYSYIQHTNGTREEVIEWSDERVSVFRDRSLIGSTVNTDAVADVPHVVTIQFHASQAEMEVSADSVVRMFVDWVRFYQRNENPGPSC